MAIILLCPECLVIQAPPTVFSGIPRCAHYVTALRNDPKVCFVCRKTDTGDPTIEWRYMEDAGWSCCPSGWW